MKLVKLLICILLATGTIPPVSAMEATSRFHRFDLLGEDIRLHTPWINIEERRLETKADKLSLRIEYAEERIEEAEYITQIISSFYLDKKEEDKLLEKLNKTIKRHGRTIEQINTVLGEEDFEEDELYTLDNVQVQLRNHTHVVERLTELIADEDMPKSAREGGLSVALNNTIKNMEQAQHRTQEAITSIEEDQMARFEAQKQRLLDAVDSSDFNDATLAAEYDSLIYNGNASEDLIDNVIRSLNDGNINDSRLDGVSVTILVLDGENVSQVVDLLFTSTTVKRVNVEGDIHLKIERRDIYDYMEKGLDAYDTESVAKLVCAVSEPDEETIECKKAVAEYRKAVRGLITPLIRIGGKDLIFILKA